MRRNRTDFSHATPCAPNQRAVTPPRCWRAGIKTRRPKRKSFAFDFTLLSPILCLGRNGQASGDSSPECGRKSRHSYFGLPPSPEKKNDIPRHHHPGAFGRDRDQQPDKYPEPKTSQTTEPLSIPHYLSPVSTQPKASSTEKRNVTDRKLSLTNSCPEGTTPRLKHTEEKSVRKSSSAAPVR